MLSYIKDIILRSPSKVISYADYISAVLYHPELGYYMKNKQKIGRQGDFITTSNVSDIFGSNFARWFLFVCQNNNLNPVFCEVGAGNGRFARSFLKEWHEMTKIPLRYIIIESSPYHRQLQHDLLQDEFLYEQAESLQELAPFEGMIFSNELFDALPVHVIEKNNGKLEEIMIGINEENLVEERVPLTNVAIEDYLFCNKIELNEGQRIEIPLSLESMLQEMEKVLLKGFITTVDYGYTYEEWMEPARKKGSLRGYYQHKMIENVLLHPGEMDITSHVHFDWLIRKGEELHLHLLNKLRQDEFLLKTGILEELQNHYDPNPFSDISKRNRAIRSLILPGGMSSFFHVVIQQKGKKAGVSRLFPY